MSFHLVGINNQNFVMQDAQTGTWWQQVSGEAILGPLKGRQLTLVPFDHLTFAAWREEAPNGRVLAPDAGVAAANRYARADWEERMQTTPAPRSAANDTRLPARALVVGIEVGGVSRAYPLAGLKRAGVVLDTLGTTPLAIVRGPDGRSTRVFDRTVDGRALELVAKVGEAPFRTGRHRDRIGMGFRRRRDQRPVERAAARPRALSRRVLVRLEDVSPTNRYRGANLLT